MKSAQFASSDVFRIEHSAIVSSSSVGKPRRMPSIAKPAIDKGVLLSLDAAEMSDQLPVRMYGKRRITPTATP